MASEYTARPLQKRKYCKFVEQINERKDIKHYYKKSKEKKVSEEVKDYPTGKSDHMKEKPH